MTKKPKRRIAAKRPKAPQQLSPAVARALAAGRVRLTVSDEEHEHLAQMLVKAWSDSDYKSRLLTFSAGAEKISKKDRDRTKKALKEVEISLGNAVVLTPQQFASYKMASNTEVVFVLPEPTGSGHTLADAKEAMVVHSMGV